MPNYDQANYDASNPSQQTSSPLIRPSTFTFGDALIRVGGPRLLQERESMYAVNAALYDMWGVADWRETIGLLLPFYLYPAEQFFGRPDVCIPSDFHGLKEVYAINLLSDTVNRWRLNIVQNIEVTHYRDWPQAICFDPGTQMFKIHPRTPDGLGAGNYVIDGTYKKRPPKILADNFNTVLPWDDMYFDVYTACLAYHMAKGPQKKDLYVEYQNLLNWMMDAESLQLGDETLSPSDPLVHPFYRL